MPTAHERTFPVTSLSPGRSSSASATLSSGPPLPSKSFALVCLVISALRPDRTGIPLYRSWSVPCPKRCKDPHLSTALCHFAKPFRCREQETYLPAPLYTSPPSSSGIVGFSPRLVPPTCTVEPGNWAVTFSLTPESVARGQSTALCCSSLGRPPGTWRSACL